jgi:hypothetical protein
MGGVYLPPGNRYTVTIRMNIADSRYPQHALQRVQVISLHPINKQSKKTL